MILISNDRTLYDLPATQHWAERIEAFFDHEVSDHLIPIDSQDANVRLHGYVVDPSISRSNNRMQYLFLNGRYIRDRSLQHALGEAYRGLLMVGRFPLCFLHLHLPSSQVDVNVHPTKCEVRFLDGGEVYRRLLQTLRAKFPQYRPDCKVRNEADEATTAPAASLSGFGPSSIPRLADTTWQSGSSGLSTEARASSTSPLLDWGRSQGKRCRSVASKQVCPGRLPEFKPFDNPYPGGIARPGGFLPVLLVQHGKMKWIRRRIVRDRVRSHEARGLRS